MIDYPLLFFLSSSLACITIAASDDPNGVFSFTIDSLHKLVKEAEENVNNDNSKSQYIIYLTNIKISTSIVCF